MGGANCVPCLGLAVKSPWLKPGRPFLLLPSTLARGSESRIYSHKVCMYVHTYVVGHAQECHAECCYIYP